MRMLPPGSTIGILGGGQLARMMGVAAAQLGYRVAIYAPEADSIAAQVATRHVCADFTDQSALAAFAMTCDVVTYEWENVPVTPLAAITDHAPLFPSIGALDVAQDRVAEKQFAADHGGVTARWAVINSAGEIAPALAQMGTAAILKSRRMGYDGKGQARVMTADDADAAWAAIGAQPAILESMVDFAHEFSVILVRGQNGETRCWDSSDNVHRGGILRTSSLPAPSIVQDQMPMARAMASRIADALDYVGVMTVEFFAGADGPIVNEIAPRVHNSGHWTIEGAVTSQFENHIRAIAGLPLGDTATIALPVRMDNLIGADVDHWPTLFADPHCHVHIYGKGAAVPGRKMGHATWVGARVGIGA